jgi:hypothetical protein
MYNENTRLIDLTVKEFKELLPRTGQEEIITTDELRKRLGTEEEPCHENRIYKYSSQGMKDAKRGKGLWSWEAVQKFLQEKFGKK